MKTISALAQLPVFFRYKYIPPYCLKFTNSDQLDICLLGYFFKTVHQLMLILGLQYTSFKVDKDLTSRVAW